MQICSHIYGSDAVSCGLPQSSICFFQGELYQTVKPDDCYWSIGISQMLTDDDTLYGTLLFMYSMHLVDIFYFCWIIHLVELLTV